MNTKIEVIKNLISALDIEQLEEYNSGDLEHWASGSYDDCFEMGFDVGYTQAILKVIKILEEE